MSDYLDLLESELRAAVARGMAQPSRHRPRLSVGTVTMALGVAASVVVAVLAIALLSPKPARDRPASPVTTPHVRGVVSAQVVAEDPTLWYRTVEIDKGSADGVRLNDLVVGDDAVVGAIASVTPDVSLVSLITDPKFAIAAKVEPSGVSGVLTAVAGDPYALRLDDLPFRSSIARGQDVVTSGLRDPSNPSIKSLSPVGITIGRISEANEAELRGHGQVEVTPAADLRHLGTVVVLTGRGVRSTELVHGSRLVLNGDGFGGLVGQTTFGASSSALQRLFDPIIGRAQGGYQATLDECGVDHTLIWPIVVNPANGQLERSEELNLFFHRGRFVGYQYGGNVLLPRGTRLRVQATTAAGLAIGDTLSTGQRLYGRAFRISTAQGGTWQASTAQGRLSGYALGDAKVSDVSPSSRVASIDAGDVGCPALSP